MEKNDTENELKDKNNKNNKNKTKLTKGKYEQRKVVFVWN